MVGTVCGRVLGRDVLGRQHHLPVPGERGGFGVNRREQQKGGQAAEACTLNSSKDAAGKAGKWLKPEKADT